MRAFFLSCLLCLAACSYAPQPVPRPLTGQHTLETAAHWRQLAAQIVRELHLTPQSRVYVADSDLSPFGRAFTDFLRNEAARTGAGISPVRDDSLAIGWNTQIIHYREPRQTIALYPGTIAAFTGAGIGGGYIVNNHLSALPVVGAAYAGLGGEAANLLHNATLAYPVDTEILVHVTAADGHGQLYDYTGVYYIRASDAVQYQDRAVALPEKTFSTTDR